MRNKEDILHDVVYNEHENENYYLIEVLSDIRDILNELLVLKQKED